MGINLNSPKNIHPTHPLQMMKFISTKISLVVDKLRRRVAYVPAVTDTVKSLQELGVDLTEDNNGKT